jgi:hypothetical protein
MCRILLCLFYLLAAQFSIGQVNKTMQSGESDALAFRKLSPALYQQNQAGNIKKQEINSFIVSVKSIALLRKLYKNDPVFKILTEDPSSGAAQITAQSEWITKALLDSNIQFIANARKPFTERELTGFDLATNSISLAHQKWPLINGNTATISIKEELLDTLDIDFKGRYLNAPSASTNLQTHATTMATIAAGGGNTFYTGKGVAWGATISNSNFSNLLPDNLNELKQLNVAVQNHSYGVGIENFYGADAAAYDAQTNQDTSLLHVFSAGNFGNQTSNSGTYNGVPGFANLSGSFKMAKNILTVGATDLLNNVISISSRGPAYDGRVKPELVALGEDGSSGAAAIVSGIGLLVREAWMKKKLTSTPPSSALIKAVLLNSADDIGTPQIDFVAGYGAVNAWRALKTIEDGNIIQGKLGPSQTNTHSISIPSKVSSLKATISWIDPPANVNSATALVNDLDFELIDVANSTKYLPWILNSRSNLTALQSSAIRGRDSINNTEQITLEMPATGVYQLIVKGSKLSSLEQSYSIAWQYDTLNHFQFTFPAKGNQLIANKLNTIRWETNMNGSATLEASLNGGNWETVSNTIDLSKKAFEWNTPNTLSICQFRMISSSKTQVSDTNLIAPIISAQTGFNCIDSFLLYWPKIGVNQYQVYQLGKQYLEPILVTNDTFFIKQKLNNPFQVYTVSPLLPYRFSGLAGYAINYTKQQTDCYINGFIADPSGNNQASITLQLGTIYQVSKVVFEKLSASGYKVIKTFSPVTNKLINSLEEANAGLNIYRAQIELSNGRVYYSNPEQVLIFADKPYYLFPNPVVAGNSLKLMSNEVDSTILSVYDLSGKKVHTQIINSFIETIRLPILPKGIFYAIIQRAGIIQKRIPFIIV